MTEIEGFVRGDVRVVRSQTEDREIVEEFDQNDRLLTRRWRPRGVLTNELLASWVWEVGEPPLVAETGNALSEMGLRAASTTPKVTRGETDDVITFVISPLTWPHDTYKVTLEGKPPTVVVRTANKKYFKRLALPEVDDIYPIPSWTWSRDALSIRVAKPPALVALEAAKRAQRSQLFAAK